MSKKGGKVKFIIGIVIGILVVIFILQNTEVVEIGFLFWTISISRALMVFMVFIVGILLGAVLKGMGKKKKKKSELPKAEKNGHN
jgi:uncharacterized integral membrane protein